jgi:hypothetical protein
VQKTQKELVTPSESQILKEQANKRGTVHFPSTVGNSPTKDRLTPDSALHVDESGSYASSARPLLPNSPLSQNGLHSKDASDSNHLDSTEGRKRRISLVPSISSHTRSRTKSQSSTSGLPKSHSVASIFGFGHHANGHVLGKSGVTVISKKRSGDDTGIAEPRVFDGMFEFPLLSLRTSGLH